MSRTLRGSASLAALLIVLASGCSSKEQPAGPGGGGEPKPTPCESNVDCGADQRCDLTAGHCVAKCKADNQCPADTGTRCDEDSGECIPGKACTADYHCQSTEPGAYCTDDAPCVCVPDKSVEERGGKQKGVCRRPAKTCEPCASTAECGEGPLFDDRPAACRVYNVGGEEHAVCLPKVKNRCPPGMIQASGSPLSGLDGLCVPQSGDCGAVNACRSDADCTTPGKPTCDPVNQICISGCYFDFVEGRSVGCPASYVCNATPQGSDPALLNSCETAPSFGIGKCTPPCGSDEECREVDPSYVCRDDGGGKRCRPQGCLSDFECMQDGGRSRGFCDVLTGSCSTDACRVGIDPRQGCVAMLPYDDCRGSFKCVAGEAADLGTCEEKNCIELGGGARGCPLGNYCSGEPYLHPMTGEPTGQKVVIPGVPEGECAPMEMETWCNEKHGSSSCGGKSDTCCRPSDLDCEFGLVGPTDHADSPPICSTFGLEFLSCFWGCENQAECPAGWNCSSKQQEASCGFETGFCETDADCAGASRCVEPKVLGGPGTFYRNNRFKLCECSATEACGEGFSCNAGIATASLTRGDPAYEKVLERYCMPNQYCGAKGSCEWFGEYNYVVEDPFPLFSCGTAPASITGVDVGCPTPEEAGGESVRPGKTPSDRLKCVKTSICQPTYLRDPNSGAAECSYVEP